LKKNIKLKLWGKKKKLGPTGDRTRNLSHPKRESYH